MTSKKTEAQIEALNEQFTMATPQEVLAYFLKEYEGRIALASSLSVEDQVLTHMIALEHPDTRIFTLDTGRLFPETYQLIDRTNLTYNISIEVLFPNYHKVEQMVREEGVNLFYNSVESRRRCCAIRKLEPLKRAFRDLDVYICGLRHAQNIIPQDAQLVEWDDMNGLVRLSPLVNWSEDDVWEYVHRHHVPYNKLYDKGYPDIGCEPCTRAVKPDDTACSGRWWWETRNLTLPARDS